MGKKHKKPVAIQILCERVGALSAWERTLVVVIVTTPPQMSTPDLAVAPGWSPPRPPSPWPPRRSRHAGDGQLTLAVALRALKRRE